MNEDIVNGKQKKCPLLNIFPLKGNSSQFYEVFHMKNWFLAKLKESTFSLPKTRIYDESIFSNWLGLRLNTGRP